MHAFCVRREMNANFDNTVCGLTGSTESGLVINPNEK